MKQLRKPYVRLACALFHVVIPGLASPGAAQSPAALPDLGTQPYGHMEMLLERTIFQIDVLTLDVCLDAPTAQLIASYMAGASMDEVEDSIVAAAIRAPAALGRIRFLRNASMDQFLDGIREEQEKAVRAGMLTESRFRLVGDSLPVWFSFLRERGIRDGDRITYVFAGDSLRTVFRDAEDRVWLDRTDVGAQGRRSVIATWLAPGTSFREPLLRSLADGQTAADGACAVPPVRQ